jgi:hypothetical protein
VNQRDFGFDFRGFPRVTTRTVSANPNYLYGLWFGQTLSEGGGYVRRTKQTCGAS